MSKIDPLNVDTKMACHLLGIKRGMLFARLKDGTLVRKKAGSKTLVTMESIKAFAEREHS